jgi:hypothetical protein
MTPRQSARHFRLLQCVAKGGSHPEHIKDAASAEDRPVPPEESRTYCEALREVNVARLLLFAQLGQFVFSSVEFDDLGPPLFNQLNIDLKSKVSA